MAELDFSGITNAGTEALKELTSVTTETSVPSTPEVTVSHPAPSIQTPAIGEPATSGQPQVTGEQAFSVDFGNGRIEQLTQAQIAQKLIEAEANGLRQKDYTVKTQEVAAQRREVEAMAQELQRRALYLQQQSQQFQQPNPQMQGFPPQQVPTPPTIDYDAPMTVAQAAQIVGTLQQQMQVQRQEILTEAEQKFADRQEVERFSASINNTLGTIYETHPVLKAEPELEDVLRYRVAQLKPATLEEAQQMFQSEAKKLVGSIEGSLATQRAAVEAQKARLTTGGIVPPGGSAPQPQKPNFMTPKGDLDWKALAEAAKSV